MPWGQENPPLRPPGAKPRDRQGRFCGSRRGTDEETRTASSCHGYGDGSRLFGEPNRTGAHGRSPHGEGVSSVDDDVPHDGTVDLQGDRTFDGSCDGTYVHNAVNEATINDFVDYCPRCCIDVSEDPSRPTSSQEVQEEARQIHSRGCDLRSKSVARG